MSVVDRHLENLKDTGHKTFDVKFSVRSGQDLVQLDEAARSSQTLMVERAGSNQIRIVGISDEFDLIQGIPGTTLVEM